MCKPMGKFAENFNLGKRVLPPTTQLQIILNIVATGYRSSCVLAL